MLRFLSLMMLFSFLIQGLQAEYRFLEISHLNEVFDGVDVEIRGFLYQNGEGRLILAADPGLRSCCVGSEKNAEKQVLVKEDIDPQLFSGYAVTLRGNLIVDRQQYPHYHLERVSVVSNTHKWEGWVVIAIILLIGVVIFVWWRLRHHQLI